MTRAAVQFTAAAAATALAAVWVAAAGPTPADPAAADRTETCAGLAHLAAAHFPIPTTEITLAQPHAAGPAANARADGVVLPAHCQVQGVINRRTGVDGVEYGDRFELRLPAEWNGRFMFQGGGGTEGSLPAAIGVAGTAPPALGQGYAVLTTDGGHDDSRLTSPVAFGLDPQAQLDFGYQTIDRATRTAKFLVAQFYGRPIDHSYAIGCSQGGRQGLVFSQRFPTYYDGIVAGAPVLDLSASSLSETNALQAIAAIVPADAAGRPEFHRSFSAADRQLFTDALLAACDAADGLKDGVIDDIEHCRFDPATFRLPSGGALQCAGAKTDSCLSAAQIGALERIRRGPRTSGGQPIVVPSGTVVAGYPYDGGYMTDIGQPLRVIGTPERQPGNITQGTNQIPYLHFDPPDPRFDIFKFNWDRDVARERKNNPVVAVSTDLAAFRDRGGKLMLYHGKSDPGPIVTNTIDYYTALSAHHGGLEPTQRFARLFLIPNMGHCRGGAATDQFDPLTAIVDWVEHGRAPDRWEASGTHFPAPATTRSRPLCPYPARASFVGPAGGDITSAANYRCVT